jgi:hypothetical protein
MQFRNIALGLVFLVVANAIRIRLEHPDPTAQMADQVAAMRKLLPRKVDEMTTQKSVDVNGKTLRFGYDVSATFQTDAATTAAVQSGLLKQFCGSADARKILEAGFTVENVYDVPTPHGPDQIRLVVKPDGCSNAVTVTPA